MESVGEFTERWQGNIIHIRHWHLSLTPPLTEDDQMLLTAPMACHKFDDWCAAQNGITVQSILINTVSYKLRVFHLPLFRCPLPRIVDLLPVVHRLARFWKPVLDRWHTRRYRNNMRVDFLYVLHTDDSEFSSGGLSACALAGKEGEAPRGKLSEVKHIMDFGLELEKSTECGRICNYCRATAS